MRARGKGEGRPRGKEPPLQSTPGPAAAGVPQPPGATGTQGHCKTCSWPCLSQGPSPVYGLEKAMIPGPSRLQSRAWARARSLPAFQPCHPLSSLIIKRLAGPRGLSQPPRGGQG